MLTQAIRTTIPLILAILLASSANAAETLSPLIDNRLLNMHSVFEHTAYQCRNNSECGVDCASAQLDIALKRENVVRLELGTGDEAWLMAIVFVDAIGKAHQTTAILSKPASCVFDNLELKTVAPVVDGVIQQPAPVEEVIFDLSPSS